MYYLLPTSQTLEGFWHLAAQYLHIYASDIDSAKPILLSCYYTTSGGEGMRCGGGAALPLPASIYFV